MGRGHAHPLCRARGEVRQDEGEGADEHARHLVDDGQLLEDGARVLEGGQERHVTVAYPRRVLHKQVGEPVRELPAAAGDGLGFRVQGLAGMNE